MLYVLIFPYFFQLLTFVTFVDELVSNSVLCQCLIPSLFMFMFSVPGPTVWNSLLDNLCDPFSSRDSFSRALKTFLMYLVH